MPRQSTRPTDANANADTDTATDADANAYADTAANGDTDAKCRCRKAAVPAAARGTPSAPTVNYFNMHEIHEACVRYSRLQILLAAARYWQANLQIHGALAQILVVLLDTFAF